MPKVHVDNETYRLLLKIKGERLARGEKATISGIIRELVQRYLVTSEQVSKVTSTEVPKVPSVQVPKVTSRKVTRRKFRPWELEPATQSQKNLIGKLIGELANLLGKSVEDVMREYSINLEELTKSEANNVIEILKSEIERIKREEVKESEVLKNMDSVFDHIKKYGYVSLDMIDKSLLDKLWEYVKNKELAVFEDKEGKEYVTLGYWYFDIIELSEKGELSKKLVSNFEVGKYNLAIFLSKIGLVKIKE